MYAIGGNPEAARLSGIRTRALRLVGLRHRRVAAAIVGILLSSQRGVATRRTRARTCFCRPSPGHSSARRASGRASSTSPGRSSASSSWASIQTGLTMLNLETYLINLVQGGILIVAVLLSRTRAARRMTPRRRRRAHAEASDRPRRSSSRGLVKRYPGVLALDHATARSCRARSLGLLGKNGAGKSTLIKILAGVVQPDAGEILDRRRAGHASTGRTTPTRARLRLRPPGARGRPEPDRRREHRARARAIPKVGGTSSTGARCARKAREVLERLGASIDPKAPLGSLAIAAAPAGDDRPRARDRTPGCSSSTSRPRRSPTRRSATSTT